MRREGIRERTGLAVHSAHTEVHHVATWWRRWSLVVVLAVVEHYHFLCCSTAVSQHTFCNNC